MKVLLAVVGVVALCTSPVSAQIYGDRITCTGVLVDVSLNSKADFPLAVIYDAKGDYTCVIDRGHAGHDPLSPCGSGKECRFIGTFKKKNDTTYFIDKWLAFCVRNDDDGDPLCKF
jgi:hypothetical protein